MLCARKFLSSVVFLSWLHVSQTSASTPPPGRAGRAVPPPPLPPAPADEVYEATDEVTVAFHSQQQLTITGLLLRSQEDCEVLQ